MMDFNPSTFNISAGLLTADSSNIQKVKNILLSIKWLSDSSPTVTVVESTIFFPKDTDRQKRI